MSKKQIEEKLSIVSDKVYKNVEVVTTRDVAHGLLLHISTDSKLGKLIPYISPRQAASEDRTVPRICTAPTILGCILGYSKTIFDFLYGFDKEVMKDTDYVGGFSIYSIDFDFALKPNSRLVYDAAVTDEHWLISYNEDTVTYNPTKVAKMFISSVTYNGQDKKLPSAEYTFYLEVLSEKLQFNSKRILDKGYYKISGPIDQETKNFKQDKDFNIKNVDAKEFDNAKLNTASLLSHKEKAIINDW